jgi:Lrp/AsnC family leucine-responsive transcriptional regulator
MKKERFDEFDRKILRILYENGRASLQEIGKEVGLSASPCWQRIKRMETAGIIKGYSARIDPAELGFRDSVIVQLTLQSHSDETLLAFEKALGEIPEVTEACLVSGEYDYYVRIAVQDTRDYERLLRDKLYRIPGIRHSVSMFVLRVLKEPSVPLWFDAAGSQ